MAPEDLNNIFCGYCGYSNGHAIYCPKYWKEKDGAMAQSSIVPKILIATPTYDGRSNNTRAIVDAFMCRSSPRVITYSAISSSLLCYNRNRAWCEALNRRMQNDCTHLLFIDSDVEPARPDWLDHMLNEMERVKAQVLGAVVPLKDSDGETSCAIATTEWAARRMTIRNLQTYPDTFTEEGLLVSTGLMLINMSDGNWHSQTHFTIKDRLTWDGEFKAEVFPEDWYFCNKCHDLGVRVWATKIPLTHWDGGTPYRVEV